MHRFLTFSILFACAFGQKQISLDDLFYNYTYRQENIRASQWYNGGEGYSMLENSSEGNELALYNSTTGKRSLLISARELTPKGAKAALRVESYSYSKSVKYVLIFTNSKRVWRTNTKGDYYVFDLKTRTLRQLGSELPESSLMFAKFSDTENRVAYVSDFNLYMENLKTGTVEKLTHDGTQDIINGTFDWVYEEEFSCQDGFRWSPNGKHIAFWQLDASAIKSFYMINNTDDVYSKPIPLQYPKVGEDPSSTKVGVVDTKTKQLRWFAIPGDPKQHYLPRMQWVNNQLLVQQLNRKQNHLKYFLCDPNTGEARVVYEERDPAYIEILNTDLSRVRTGLHAQALLRNGESILINTEKDGWSHVYNFDLKAKKEILLTHGNYDVGAVYRVDEPNNALYISASPNNATQRYLHRASLDGTGKTERLTPAKYAGVNRYSISPNGRYAIHWHSNANTPQTIRFIELPSHKTLRVLAANETYAKQMKELDLPVHEFFEVTTADGVRIDGRMLKPRNFDKNEKYPVIIFTYGEPWGQTAVDRWNFGIDHYFAQEGFIVLTVDNRGTPSLKGREWRKSIYKKVGVINSHDQAAALREIVKWPFIDAKRIGVWGHSGGGSMTLNLLFRYPELYAAGVSLAPVSYQPYYDNVYQERYMGLLQEDPEPFIEGSPVTHAKNLQGKLLLIHGTGDDNVHYQNAERLINELVKHNKQFEFMAYPNRTHGIWEGRNTARHRYTLMVNFFKRHLN